MLFDQTPSDLRVFGVVISTMLTVAVVASLIPAARAAS
jgi:ABC-type lipoprotein release transport system permease subunit